MRIRRNGDDGTSAECELESAIRASRSRGQFVWPQGQERAEPTSLSRVKRVLAPPGPQLERRLNDDLRFAYLKAYLMVDANEVHIAESQALDSVTSSYYPAL